ncbi:hypothetical protein A2U01_0071221, partial [Trifolium medium]|nr:hypothetical protein [Trifolium medium]
NLPAMDMVVLVALERNMGG